MNTGSVRYFLAKNPNISKETQLILANDFYFVSEKLASNPCIQQEVQLILIKDAHLKLHLAKNPNICKKAKEILISQYVLK